MRTKRRQSVFAWLAVAAVFALATALLRAEDIFNEIYTTHHAPELASIPGFTGAQRMIMARPDTARVNGTKYLALFTVETSDLAAVKQGTSVRGTPNPGQDGAGTRGYTFRAFAPQVLGDVVRAERTKGTKH